ncbi:ABC transporter transmembrane domain-containing protein [Acuticoccus sediminis]|uniref:ABC transporter transmembrane domain-containing protein n=1 Tax=Acuticoccus sediminis TaxID=2184697 RepID=UPI001CFDCDEC|nr:ABC transporter transmembrane domain-containing protein [Acuticoccus sediminis]
MKPRSASPSVPAAESKRVRLAPLRFLWPYALRYKGRLAAAFVAMLAATGATLAVPMAVRRMIDHGFGPDNAGLIDSYFAMLIVVAGALALASSSRLYLVTTLGERVVADVRSDVFARVMTLSPGYFDRTLSGEIVSRLTADTTQIKAAVGSSASVALRNLLMFIGAMAMMVATSPTLSATALAAIPVLVLPLVAVGRRVRRRSRAAQDKIAAISAYATEAIGSVRMLQSFGAERRTADHYRKGALEAFGAARSATAARAVLTAVVIFIVFSAIVGVLWMGAQEVLRENLTAGALSQFVLYAVFAAGALSELSQVWGDIAQTAGAAERLSILAAEEPDVASPASPVPFPQPAKGAVRFENVSFAYPAEPARPVLNGVSFMVEPGATVALVGPSGAGKTTIFQLIGRSYDVGDGAVLLDGVDVRQADLAALREHIALVPQDTTILAASIADNIRLGRPNATDREVVEAARAAHVDRFVMALPEGYDTVVGERGITLSGGQRQRIAIARAILKDAPLLLLDEATSSLDAESEAHIQAALEHLMADRTTIVIAHRLATVVKADRILVMEDGAVVDAGTHAELSARDGVYRRLAKLQFHNTATAAPEDEPAEG